MKNFIILFSLLLVSCGKDTHTIKTETKEKEVFVDVIQKFEGKYQCDNYSNLELSVDYADRVSFDTAGQSLNSINPVSDQLGTHPTVSERDLIADGDKISIAPRNYNYSSSTHDIEEDASGSNITGQHRTDIILTKTGEDTLKIKFLIFQGAVNSNINSVIAERELNCER